MLLEYGIDHSVIVKTALLGLVQSLWSFGPAGGKGHIDDDKQVDGLIDRMKEAPTKAALLQAGYDFQRYVTGAMLTCGIASLPFFQATRADVKGDVYLHGYKVRFETTWLDRP